jgi:hypothetical protein
MHKHIYVCVCVCLDIRVYSAYIITCTGLGVTKITVVRIYWPFFVQSHLITSHTALSLIYTLSSSQLRTRTRVLSLH